MTEQQPPMNLPPVSPPIQDYGQPPAYPQAYYPPPPKKTSTEPPLIALILSAIGIVYPFPPLVLPIVALYLVHKSKKEMKAGRVFESKDAGTQLKIAKVLAIVGIVWAILMLAYMVFFLTLFFNIGHYHRASIGEPVTCGDNLTVTVENMKFLVEGKDVRLMEGHDYLVLELSFTNNKGVGKNLSYKDIYIERSSSGEDYDYHPIEYLVDYPKVPKLVEGVVEPNETVVGYLVFDVIYRFGSDLYFRYEPEGKDKIVVPLD